MKTTDFIDQAQHVAATHDERPVGSAGNQIVVEGGCGLQHGLFLLVRQLKSERRQ